MKQIFIFLLAFFFLGLFSTNIAVAQYQNLGNATPAAKKLSPWFVGGMLGGSFGSYGGSLEVSPLVGYRVTSDFHVGSRITYIYSRINYGGYIGKQSFHDYGASLFARYRFLKMLFGHVEYEVLNIQYPYDFGTGFQIKNKVINSLFVGGGLYQQMGGRGFATIAILFNVLENEFSPYSNPIIRVGFGVGL